jgi:hypothetical protein
MENYFGVVQSVTQKPLDLGFSSCGAWSVRNIRSAYSGFPINLRRSSDNVQVDVSFDAQGNISGSSSVSSGGNLTAWAGADSLFVVTWYDQSGSGFNLTNGTAASQWQFLLDGGPLVNNKPVLVNTGGARSMSGSGDSRFMSPHDFSLFTVFGNQSGSSIFLRISDPSANMFCRLSTLSSSRMTLRIYNTANALNYQVAGGNPAISSFTQMGWSVSNGATPAVFPYQNTIPLTQENSSNAWANTSVTTVQYFLGVTTYTGSVSELIIAPSSLNNAQSQAINVSQKNYFHTT